MTARVTACEVKEIRPTTANVEPMILAASAVVDRINADCGKSFDASELTLIELWLAAHFVGTIDPTKKSERFENWQVSFQLGSDNLEGVKTDKYGQTANLLSGGCLAQIGKKPATVDFL